MSLGNKLRALRENRGWTRAEAARQLELKYTTYVGYENDEREPGHNFLVDSARLYGVSLDYLLGLSSQFSESQVQYTSSATITRQTLKDEERILLSHFGELDEEEQRFFLKQMERAARERGETDDNG